MKQWQPNSWQNRLSHNTPTYLDEKAYHAILAKLRALYPLVTLAKVRHLHSLLARATLGDLFLFQGGDCAERFADCHSESIQQRIMPLLHGSLVLGQKLGKPIIKIGRIAGQYAKSRSATSEMREHSMLPSYFGDLVNRPYFDKQSRSPNPKFLLQAYRCSHWTLSFLSEMARHHFNNQYKPHYWQLDFLTHLEQRDNYLKVIEDISQTLNNADKKEPHPAIQETLQLPFFTSHEALHLPYEEALTRQEPLTGKWYNLGTHFPWIGMRTLDLESAHIEYIRGIYNPIGVKVGPNMPPDTLAKLVDTLNPEAEPGRLSLITRLGSKHIQQKLPALISAVKMTGKPVLWISDPMHGNIKQDNKGNKVRYFDNIATEVKLAFSIHEEHNSRLGGIHLEMTGENLTECIGGNAAIKGSYHKPLVDPRLNYEQVLELLLSL